MKTRSFFCLCLLSFAGSSFASEPSAVARIGGTEIKVAELESEIGLLNPEQRAAFTQEPALLNQAVRALLVQRLVLKEAKGKKWQDRPEVVEQLKRLQEGAIVESYLQSVSEPPADFPSETELKAAYEQNKDALMLPRQFQLSQVFVTVSGDAEKEEADKAKARIDAATKQLSSKPFAELVGEYSDEKSGANEAELQWIAETQLQPAIREAIKALAKGGVTKPIQLEDGWHIVKVVDARDARVASFDEVREPLKLRLRAERQQAERIEFVNGLLKANPISINELELTRLLQSATR